MQWLTASPSHTIVSEERVEQPLCHPRIEIRTCYPQQIQYYTQPLRINGRKLVSNGGFKQIRGSIERATSPLGKQMVAAILLEVTGDLQTLP